VFLAFIQVLAIGLNLAGIRLTGPLCMIILGISLTIAAAVGYLSRYGQKSTGEGNVSASAAPASFLPCSISWVAFLTCAILMGVIALTAYERGDVSYDGNAYHILPMNEWAVSGHFSEVNPSFNDSPFANGYPKGAESVAFVLAEAFGSRALTMQNILYAPLGLLGIGLLCQLFGASLRDSFVLGVCFVMVPANISQFGSTYVDTAFACSMAGMLGLLAFRCVIGGPLRLLEGLIIGAAIGNVVAIKSNGSLIAIVVMICFAVCGMLLSRERIKVLKSFMLWQYALVSLLVACAVGAFWYVRNYILHGNPLYPVEISLLGHKILPGTPFSTIIPVGPLNPPLFHSMPMPVSVLISWAVPLFRLKAWYHEVQFGALGILWIMVCVPAIVASCYYTKSKRFLSIRQKMTYCCLFAIMGMALLVTPLPFTSRYTIWLFALGLPSVCIAIVGAQQSRPKLVSFFRGWVSACVGLLLIQAVVMGAVDGLSVVQCTHTRGQLLVHFSLRDRPMLPLYPEMHSPLLADILNNEKAIAVGPDGNLGDERRIYGQLSQPLGRHDLIPVTASVTAEDMQRLRSVPGLHYVLWHIDRPVPPALEQQVKAVVTDGEFTILQLVANGNLSTRSAADGI